MILLQYYTTLFQYTIPTHTRVYIYIYRYHNTTLLHYTTSSVLHHSITSHSICIIHITTQRVLPAHNIYPLLHYLTVYIKSYNDTLSLSQYLLQRVIPFLTSLIAVYLSIYLSIYRIYNIYVAPFPLYTSLYRSKLYLDIHSKK